MSSIPAGHHSLSLAAGLGRVESLLDAASSRVSSGRRVDRPAADPAGLGQASKLQSEQARLRAAEVNIQNGVSRLQVTGGQLTALSRFVTRLSEITTLGANAAQNPSERALYSAEFNQIQGQVRQIVGGTTAEIGGPSDVAKPLGNFNDRPLFGPGPGDTLVVGSGEDERLTLPVINLRQGPVGDLIRQDASGSFTLSFNSTDGAALGSSLRAALDQISTSQAQVGAGQSRLHLAASLAATASVNHESALSVILDADIAAETTGIARFKILSEGHTAMMAQARDVPAKLVSLLTKA